MKSLPTNKEILTIQEAAKVLDVSTKTLRRWEESGTLLPHRTAGGHRRYLVTSLQDFIDRRDHKSETTKPVSPIFPPVVVKPIEIPQATKKTDSVITPKVKILPQPMVASHLKQVPHRKIAYKALSAFALIAMILGGVKAGEKLNLGGNNKPISSQSNANVLAESDLLQDLEFNVYVPTNLRNDVNIEGDYLSVGDGTPNIIDLEDGDTYITDDLEVDGVIYGNGSGITGIATYTGWTFAIGGTAEDVINSGETLNLTSSTGLTITSPAENQINLALSGDVSLLGQSIESSEITDNTITASELNSTLTFADGDFIDLSAITHGSSTSQGLKLPQSTSLTNLSSGEGFIAWDTDDNALQVYDGSSWSSINGGGGSGLSDIENNDVAVGTNVDTLDFSTDFTVSASPANEANVSIADDILNFTEFSDSLTLDTATTITNSLSGDLLIDLTSTGDFEIADGGTTFAAFTDSGTFTLDSLTLDGTSIASSGDLSLVPSGGDTNATGNLDVSGHAAIGANSAVNDGSVLFAGSTYSNILSLQETFTDFSSDYVQGITNYLDLNPSGAVTSDVYAIDSEAIIRSGNSQNFGAIVGTYSSVEQQGSGTVTNLSGVQAFATRTAGTVTSTYGILATGQDGLNAYGGFFTGRRTIATAGNTRGLNVQANNTGVVTSGADSTIGIHNTITRTGATGGSLVTYGYYLDVAGLDNAGAGSHTAYGVYLEDVTGADTNYSIYSAGGQSYFAGNVGIGDTTPSAQLEVGNGTDSLQVSTTGDLTFVDANDGSSITGPAGGTLTLTAGASQDLSLTGADDIIFDDAQISGTIQLSVSDGSFDSGDTGIIDAINTAYGAATGGGGGLWQLSTNVINPTTATQDFAIGGSTLAASIFSIDESTATFLFGGDQSANPILTFEATDSDTGDFGFNTNDSFYFSGANVGIGDTSPSALLEVGDGTDSIQVSSTGDLTFVDADGAASITGPAGGSLSINSGASQDLTFTASDDITFDDAQLSSAVNLSISDSAINASLTQGIIDAINDLYDLGTSGGGSSIWSLTSGVINPTTATNDFAIGGSTLAASVFGIDESAATFYFGYDNSASPTLEFEASDADAGTFGFNTNDAFYFSNAGVGIGTTNPSSGLLQVSQTSGTATYSTTTASSGTTTTLAGLYGLSSTTGTAAATTGAGVYGAYTYSGSGTTTLGAGGYFTTLTTGSAPVTANNNAIYAQANTNLTSSSLAGIRALSTSNNSTGTVGNLYGYVLSTWGQTAAGTTTNAYGMQIGNITNSGTLSNTYGIHIGDITTGTQTNTPFSFYASDASALNYFAGSTGIGTTAPDRAIEINSASGNNLRLTYNDSNGSATAYSDFSLASSGALTINTAGSSQTFNIAGTSELVLGATNLEPGTAEGNSLGSASVEWEQLFLGDGNGIAFGLDQDWTFGYDEATDDRLELTTSGTTGFLLSTAATTGTGALFGFDSVTSGVGMSISADALQDGEALFVQSTTTSASFSGNLGLFEWAPGSATTASADLFKINIGSNGTTTGDLFAISDNGSDVFSVSESQITSALPHQFTAAGDVAVAYDMQFTNQTSSYIKSNAPLYIEAGENFENNDLTLTTYGTGNVILDPSDDGYVQLQGATRLNTQVTLANDATPDVSAGSWFTTGGTTTITDFDAGSGSLEDGHMVVIESAHSVTIDCNGNAEMDCGAADIALEDDDVITFIYDGTEDIWRLVSWVDDTDTQTGADVAELFPSSETLEAGDVVSIHSTQPVTMQKAIESDGQKVVGIVSTQPGLTLQDGNTNPDNSYPVALVGRVPVKVDPSSEQILPGDLIVASPTAGRAKKVNGSGWVIGRALDTWIPGQGQDKITVFVNPFYLNQAEYVALSQTETEGETLTPPTTTIDQILSHFTFSETEDVLNIEKVETTNLTVLNDAVLGDTVITGTLNIGTLSIDSLDNSINAVGVLKIQPMALGNIEFMGGLITFDTEGNITVNEITANKYKVAGTSAGTGTIEAGETEVVIETTQVEESSLIFVTPKKALAYPLAVTTKVEGESFKVEVSFSELEDVEFDWWIVDHVTE